MTIRAILAVLILGFSLILAGCGEKAETFITVASTTSTENSGLFEAILPQFEQKTGIEVRVVAVGTGRALEMARRGDADVLFVHHTPSEIEFVEQGYGVARHDVMYNDFVLLGPADDPAGAAHRDAAPAAFAAIAETGAPFVSRGDDSGTHKKELSLWQAAGVAPAAFSGAWYRETGAGMGATLNVAKEMPAYTLSDRATWLNFSAKGDLTILLDGDPRLFNPYGIILVSPERHPHVKAAAGRRFIDWILSDEGQQAIAEYRIRGRQAFFPNAD